MSAIAGRVLIIPKGAYDANTTYHMLDAVSYNGNSYIAKQTTAGNTPSAAPMRKTLSNSRPLLLCIDMIRM